MDIHAFYRSIAVDPARALGRFGSEALLKKYLHKLSSDPTFADLERAVAQNNPQLAFLLAHNLKGMSLSLSIDPLINPSTQLAQLLQNAFALPPQVPLLLSDLSARYQSILCQLERLDP